jgi:hypothetical protein
MDKYKQKRKLYYVKSVVKLVLTPCSSIKY